MQDKRKSPIKPSNKFFTYIRKDSENFYNLQMRIGISVKVKSNGLMISFN